MMYGVQLYRKEDKDVGCIGEVRKIVNRPGAVRTLEGEESTGKRAKKK